MHSEFHRLHPPALIGSPPPQIQALPPLFPLLLSSKSNSLSATFRHHHQNRPSPIHSLQPPVRCRRSRSRPLTFWCQSATVRFVLSFFFPSPSFLVFIYRLANLARSADLPISSSILASPSNTSFDHDCTKKISSNRYEEENAASLEGAQAILCRRERPEADARAHRALAFASSDLVFRPAQPPRRH